MPFGLSEKNNFLVKVKKWNRSERRINNYKLFEVLEKEVEVIKKI